MRKEFEFTVKNHRIKIVNSWFTGAKLYVDGHFCDKDYSLFAFGNKPLLSANLAEFGILEIFPKSALISVEIDAFLINHNEKQHVFSSHKRLSLKEKRLAIK